MTCTATATEVGIGDTGPCDVCGGEGWVCEEHPEMGFDGDYACMCGGAGIPCKCNLAQPPWAYVEGRRSAQVLGDRLLVERDDPTDVTLGGIHLPANAQRAALRGTVVALGTGKDRKTGKIKPYEVTIGDRVLFSPNLGEEWQGGSQGRGEVVWPGFGPRAVVMIREADIIGIEEGEPAHLLSGRRAGRLRADVGKVMSGAQLEA